MILDLAKLTTINHSSLSPRMLQGFCDMTMVRVHATKQAPLSFSCSSSLHSRSLTGLSLGCLQGGLPTGLSYGREM